MKKIKILAYTTAFLLLAVTSCKDSFLDEKLQSAYTIGITDPRTIDAQVVGLHRTFAELWGYSSNQGFIAMFQTGMDICSPGSTQNVEKSCFQYSDFNSSNAGVGWLWNKCYDFINNANIVIAAAKDSLKSSSAEAKFFRAYAYNMLVTFWGDVPLISDALLAPRTDFTRQKVADIDALIDADLTYAIANLPDQGKEAYEGRINKDNAMQLAAEVYLRIGMRDNSYYAKAVSMTTQIIKSGHYQLIQARYGVNKTLAGDYYYDMFRYGSQRRAQGNTESMWTFEMEYNKNVTNGTIDNPQFRRIWIPQYRNIPGMANSDSLSGRGNGILRLSNYFKYTLWNGLAGDIRNSNFNIRRKGWYNKPGYTERIGLDASGFRIDTVNRLEQRVQTVTVKTGDPIIIRQADTVINWYTFCTKWGQYDPNDDIGFAVVKDWPIQRFAETYLLRAEAYFRLNKPDSAAADINVLRGRAFKDARTSSGNSNLGAVSSSDITIDFILDERARELIGEENRRMTLMRTGKLADRVALNQDLTYVAKPTVTPPTRIITGFDPSKNILWPIPFADLTLNSGAVLQQNPGY